MSTDSWSPLPPRGVTLRAAYAVTVTGGPVPSDGFAPCDGGGSAAGDPFAGAAGEHRAGVRYSFLRGDGSCTGRRAVRARRDTGAAPPPRPLFPTPALDAPAVEVVDVLLGEPVLGRVDAVGEA